MAKTVFVLNGPNLNLLGTREPAVLSAATLRRMCRNLCAQAAARRRTLALRFHQSDHEGQLIDWTSMRRASCIPKANWRV